MATYNQINSKMIEASIGPFPRESVADVLKQHLSMRRQHNVTSRACKQLAAKLRLKRSNLC